MSHVPPLGAVDKETKHYVPIKLAVKGTIYTCPGCNDDLTVAEGKIRAKHFRHLNKEDSCLYYRNPSDLQIHKEAQNLLKSLLERRIPITMLRNCSSCGQKSGWKIPEMNEQSEIRLEYCFNHEEDRKFADVAYLDNSSLRYIFEIYNTHRTESKNRPEPWFEINATNLIELGNDGNLEKLTIPCIRTDCINCIKLSSLKKIDLEKYVRAKLGQNLDKLERNKYGRPVHKRIDLSCVNCGGQKGCEKNCRYETEDSSCNDLKWENNKEICDLFNNDNDFGQYRIVIHTWKGIADIYIINKDDYERVDYWAKKYRYNIESSKLPYHRRLDSDKYGGTVKALLFLLRFTNNIPYYKTNSYNKHQKKYTNNRYSRYQKK
jgi:hypothetical protein